MSDGRGRCVVLQIAGPPPPETLRHDQRARRDRIVRAALRALVHDDYEHLKVSDIARDSDVALGTLYRYFASKEHLFAAAFYEWEGAMKVKLERAAPSGATEQDRLSDVFRRTIRAFQVNPQFFRVLLMLQTTSDPYAAEIQGSLGSLFRETVQSAFDGPFDVDREAIYATVNAVLDQGLRSWVMGRSTITEVYEAVDDALRLIYTFTPAPSRPNRRRA
jgi:AcrR family transcriptional regulator